MWISGLRSCHLVLQKSRSMSSAGPWLLGFFVFVLVGSGEYLQAPEGCTTVLFHVTGHAPCSQQLLGASLAHADAHNPFLSSQLSCRSSGRPARLWLSKLGMLLTIRMRESNAAAGAGPSMVICRSILRCEAEPYGENLLGTKLS